MKARTGILFLPKIVDKIHVISIFNGGDARLVTRRVTFRLYPKPNAEKKLYWARRMHKELYNSAIANCRTQYERFGQSVSYYEQQNSLPAFKEVWTEYKQLGSQTLQATLKRVDLVRFVGLKAA